MVLAKRKESKKTEKEQVDERREEVLARGRKFKYPVQWTHHNIVVRAILIAVIVLLVIVMSCWAALYVFGWSDALLYNVTRVFPLQVATVEGRPVRFSDYLMLYQSSMTSAEKQSGGQISASMEELEQKYKREALMAAEKYVYAEKLAEENGVSVSEEEIEEEFQRHLKVGGVERSREAFVKIVEDNFGLSEKEYKRMLEMSLLEAKVAEAVDKQANATMKEVERLLAENGGDYAAVAETLGERVRYEDTGGLVDSKNIDGGRATMALQLEPGEQSGRFLSMNGDGYYYVKLVDKADSQVNFVSIMVPFSEFEEQFQEVLGGGKIEEKIKIEGGEW